MDMTLHYVGLFAATALFLTGTVLSIVGLVTTQWMLIGGNAGDEVRIGLFEICVKQKFGSEVCVDTVDNPNGIVAAEENFIACRILIIAGIALAGSSFVGSVVFLVLNRRGKQPNKGSYMATMICAISSILCFAGALLIFGLRIYNDLFDLKYSFILTCVAAGLIFIACFLFPTCAYLILSFLRSTSHASSGMVVSQFNPAQQGMQQPYSVGGYPGVAQYNHYTPGPQNQRPF